MKTVTISNSGTSKRGNKFLQVVTYSGDFEVQYLVMLHPDADLDKYPVGEEVEIPEEALRS